MYCTVLPGQSGYCTVREPDRASRGLYEKGRRGPRLLVALGPWPSGLVSRAPGLGPRPPAPAPPWVSRELAVVAAAAVSRGQRSEGGSLARAPGLCARAGAHVELIEGAARADGAAVAQPAAVHHARQRHTRHAGNLGTVPYSRVRWQASWHQGWRTHIAVSHAYSTINSIWAVLF